MENIMKQIVENLKLNYSFGISESFSEGENKEFIIKGTAINETVTSNGHEFLASELRPSAHTLSNKPLLKDHINSVDNIVGKTGVCSFSENEKCVKFLAKVTDKDMQEKIRDGLVSDVSVGAIVDKAEYDEERGVYVLSGIKFKELSLVAVPADENANFAMAIACAMDFSETPKNISELNSEEVDSENDVVDTNKEEENNNQIIEDSKMEEELQVAITEKDAEIAKLKTEAKAMVEAELERLKASYIASAEAKDVTPIDVSALDKSTIEALTKQLESVKVVKEEDETPVEPEKPVEDDSTGVVSEEPEEDTASEGNDLLVTENDVYAGVGLFKTHVGVSEDSVYHRG